MEKFVYIPYTVLVKMNEASSDKNGINKRPNIRIEII